MLTLKDPQQSLDIKKVVNLWIVRRNDDGFGCELCSENNIPELNNFVKQKKSSGYSNLKLHLDNRHDGWRQRLMLESATDNVYKEPTLDNYFTVLLSVKAKNIYGWMNLIISNHYF